MPILVLFVHSEIYFINNQISHDFLSINKTINYLFQLEQKIITSVEFYPRQLITKKKKKEKIKYSFSLNNSWKKLTLLFSRKCDFLSQAFSFVLCSTNCSTKWKTV